MVVDRLIEIKDRGHAMLACDWYNSRQRTDVAMKQLHARKQSEFEMVQANKELLLLRRARMKEYLAAESEQCAFAPAH